MDYRFIFGPVPSRRLGLSLGIDVIPKKTCTFDCIYCEVGRTTNKTVERSSFFDPQAIVEEMKRFSKERKNVDFVTFSGSGEPTLCKNIGYLARRAKEIFKKPLALITNSSLLWREDVLEDIEAFDVVMPSLDACTQEVFERINRPAEGITVELIKEGLLKLKGRFKGSIYLEILFVKGVNNMPREVELLKEFVQILKPHKVHINTVFRPPPERWVKRVDDGELSSLKKVFGDMSEVCSPFKREPEASGMEEVVIKALKVRPMTVEDISKVLGKSPLVVMKILEFMVSKGLLKKEIHGGEVFFRLF